MKPCHVCKVSPGERHLEICSVGPGIYSPMTVTVRPVCTTCGRDLNKDPLVIYFDSEEEALKYLTPVDELPGQTIPQESIDLCERCKEKIN